MNKRILPLLGFIFAIASIESISAQFGDFSYSSDGSSIRITGYSGDGSAIIIPESIVGLPVEEIGSGAFDYLYSLYEVVLPNTVKTIGSSSFDHCGNLTNIVLGTGLTNIGTQAFYYCTSLETATLPNSLETIDESAFRTCRNLNSAIIPDKVVSIGRSAFYGCSAITNLQIGTNVTVIGNRAFSYCRSIPSIVIPDNVTTIENHAFEDCDSVTNVYIGSGVLDLFLVFPGESPHPKIETFEVSSNNPAYSSLNGVLFDKTQTTLVAYPSGKSGDYSIPPTVNHIGSRAFFSCSDLPKVTINNNIPKIGYETFKNCSSLEDVIFGSGITNLESRAFYNCTNLNRIYFSGNRPTTEADAFFRYHGTFNVTTYYLPDAMGWHTPIQDFPMSLWKPTLHSTGLNESTKQISFDISWASDQVIIIEASTNLVDNVWIPIESEYMHTETVSFIDAESTNFPTRYYRVISN